MKKQILLILLSQTICAGAILYNKFSYTDGLGNYYSEYLDLIYSPTEVLTRAVNNPGLTPTETL